MDLAGKNAHIGAACLRDALTSHLEAEDLNLCASTQFSIAFSLLSHVQVKKVEHR